MANEQYIPWRAFFDPNKLLMRKFQMVYLSEESDGTLSGTEKMTRRQYAAKQKFKRMAMGLHADGLRFSESQEAVAYRGRKGFIETKRQFGKWIVWEKKGGRPDSLNITKNKK
jgi:hypothetical protein